MKKRKPKYICRKRRYRDELDAKIALANMQRSRKSTREEFRVYYHADCRAWHTTSQPLKEKHES